MVDVFVNFEAREIIGGRLHELEVVCVYSALSALLLYSRVR